MWEMMVGVWEMIDMVMEGGRGVGDDRQTW